MPTIEIMRDTFASGNGSNEEVEIVIASPYGQLADKQTRIRHLKLYQAALSGDWSMAEAAAEQTDFLKNLVDNINKEDLATINNAGNTAFCLAAVSGNVELAQKVELPNMIEESTNLAYVLERSRNLAMIRGRNEMLPLSMAALFGHKEMVQCLYEATDDESLYDNNRIELLITLISNDLLERHSELAVADGNEETALLALARTPIASQIQQGFWKQCVNLC
ncbi:hypothetical protein Pint_12219 [Pistacia integerrima]|uniref:Uncharacterized protein n=1 Tax=Pistacia integerrima TaxID=434235 RepID=A0ACC0XJG7_9ROSI|nr:hypothetical protein Pint_12219 [Pistacia integerrima]